MLLLAHQYQNITANDHKCRHEPQGTIQQGAFESSAGAVPHDRNPYTDNEAQNTQKRAIPSSVGRKFFS
jgi:hypothetical protein